MSADLNAWHVVNFVTSGLAAVIAWVARDHIKRDDERFDRAADSMEKLNNQLDRAIKQTAEILQILLKKQA